MTYNLCKRIIMNTNYQTQEQKDDMQLKLDVFLLNKRIDADEYNELTQLLADKPITQ